VKTHEAETILAAIEDIYSTKVEERGEWLMALEGADGDAASALVLTQWATGKNLPRHLPELPAFIKQIEIEKALAEREPPVQAVPAPHRSPLIPVNPELRPRWVQVWELARAKGDMRALPEQEWGYRDDGYEWPPEAGVMPPERRAELEAELDRRDG